jgi:hypothetical protein
MPVTSMPVAVVARLPALVPILPNILALPMTFPVVVCLCYL